jgi:hypothetical protein
VGHGFTTPTIRDGRGEIGNMTVTVGTKDAKSRKIYQLATNAVVGLVGVHNHSLGNVRRGLIERVFNVERDGVLVPTIKPNPLIVENTLRHFRSRFLRAFGSCYPVTPQEFLGFYKGTKRQMYERAVKELDVRAYEARDAWLTTFVKAEKICLWLKPDPAPRVIQPRSPRYNVELGCYLRHIEHRCFDTIHKVFTETFPCPYKGATVFKGLTADEGGEIISNIWGEFDKPVGIGMDASRFDQHVSKDMLEWEHSIYLSLYKGKDTRTPLRQLLRDQINNRGLARCPDGEVKYNVEGCRMSGDMNTSLGNCLIMCATVHEFMRSKKIHKYRLINNGDDCVLFVEKRELKHAMDGLPEYYTSLGFTMAVEKPVFVLEQVEFCQTNPIKVNGSYRMVRTLNSITKDSYSLKQMDVGNIARDWVSAVGTGGLALNSGVPVLQPFYQCFPTNGVTDVYSSQGVGMFEYKFHTHRESKSSEISEETRYSYYLATGLTADEQRALENGFTPINFTWGDFPILHPPRIHGVSRE